MERLLAQLNQNWPPAFEHLALLRDSGSLAYAAYSNGKKYFLRVVKPSLAADAEVGAEVQMFLHRQGFPTPEIIPTRSGRPGLLWESQLLLLYEYIEGEDCVPDQDPETIGRLAGRLHREMRAYPKPLPVRDRQFYIGRYVDVLRKKHYPRAEEYATYGEALWERLKTLPTGPCHGDLYCGNIRRTPDGGLYVYDFDTACIGFPMYDLTLIADQTEYFCFDEANYRRSHQLLARMLPAYREEASLSREEEKAFPALIATQHFSTQATITELFGPDCLSDENIDAQLDWLYRWQTQWEAEK